MSKEVVEEAIYQKRVIGDVLDQCDFSKFDRNHAIIVIGSRQSV